MAGRRMPSENRHFSAVQRIWYSLAAPLCITGSLCATARGGGA